MTRGALRFTEAEWKAYCARSQFKAPAAPESPAPTPPSAPGGGGAPLLYPLVALCRSATLPEPTPEYSFHHTRKWRFDYAWPLRKIAVEIEGGIWTRGRHTRGSGFLADMEKYNEAAIHGWRILRYTPEQLDKQTATIIGDLLVVLG